MLQIPKSQSLALFCISLCYIWTVSWTHQAIWTCLLWLKKLVFSGTLQAQGLINRSIKRIILRLLSSEFLGCLSIRLEQTHSVDAPSDCDLGSCGLEALLKLLDFYFFVCFCWSSWTLYALHLLLIISWLKWKLLYKVVDGLFFAIQSTRFSSFLSQTFRKLTRCTHGLE